MKAAFINSDRNITVSMNYAKEISGSASKGVELNTIINATGGIEGIVNGMDPTEWNPATDKFLDITYDKNTVTMGKAAAKQALQAEVGLPLDPSAPVFGYIGRLEEQKGCDIMMEAVPKLLKQCPNAQVVILGTGKKSMEKTLEKLDKMSPRMAGVVRFSNPSRTSSPRVPIPDGPLPLRALRPHPAPRHAVRHRPHRRLHRWPRRHRQGGRDRLPHGRHGPRRSQAG